MAAPGYPQMGQMPPGMGGPPMGGPPMSNMQTPMPQRQVKRGTSKAVPIVVSAGLAVGVFCGLLFGVGTGKEATAGVSKGNNVGKGGNAEEKPDLQGLGATTTVAPKTTGTGSAGSAATAATGTATTGAGAGSAVAVAAAGSAAGSTTPAGAGTGSATPAAAEEKKVTKLTFKLKPDAAASGAKISVNGKELDGTTLEVPADTKSIKVEIKANGFKTIDKKQELATGGAELTIEYEMQKKSGGGGTRPPRRPDRPTNAGGGGGLIDI